MTNAEKYLKDGVSVEELSQKFYEFCNSTAYLVTKNALTIFFEQPIQPTLTEDERVILRNIEKNNFIEIGRCEFSLYLKTQTGTEDCSINYMYHHLFQFIKERRRI